ncbi:MAG: PAS domain-containing protein [Nitrospiraceae bacterium]|nr:PAS domain-containing protein [Nitrospiraceae bacterium]
MRHVAAVDKQTRGIESPFAVFYMVKVMLASLLLKGGGGLATAGLSVLLFGLVTFVQSVQLLEWSPPSRLPETETMYAFGIHSMAVMVVGLLSSALTGQLKRAGQSLVEKEQGLSRLQAFHENVVQSLSSGLFTTDASARITSFNRAAREITKYSLEAVHNRLWWEAFNWEQANLFEADPSTLVGPYRFEGEGRRADGSRVVLGMTLAPLTENGVRTGLVGAFKILRRFGIENKKCDAGNGSRRSVKCRQAWRMKSEIPWPRSQDPCKCCVGISIWRNPTGI